MRSARQLSLAEREEISPRAGRACVDPLHRRSAGSGIVDRLA
jgi:hypothetical protein